MSSLAFRAVHRGATADHRARQDRPAAEAGLATAPVDLQLLLHRALRVPDVAVVVDRRAPAGDSLVQDDGDGVVDGLPLPAGEAMAAPRRAHTGEGADLVDIDGAEPGEAAQ